MVTRGSFENLRVLYGYFYIRSRILKLWWHRRQGELHLKMKLQSRFCNFSSIILSRLACKIFTNYPVKIIWHERVQRWKEKTWNFVVNCSRCPRNCKSGHFTWLTRRGWFWNVQKCKAYVQSVQRVQSYCFHLLNMQICDVLVTIFLVA